MIFIEIDMAIYACKNWEILSDQNFHIMNYKQNSNFHPRYKNFFEETSVKKESNETDQIIYENLLDLIVSFKDGELIDVIKDFHAINSLLDQKKDYTPELISQNQIFEILNIFANTNNLEVKKLVLIFFNILITKNRDCVHFLIDNGFINLIVDFKNKLQKEIPQSITLALLKVIHSLLVSNIHSQESILLFSLDFICDFYDSLITESSFCEWLKCLDACMNFPMTHEFCKILLETIHKYLISIHDNSYNDSKILNLIISMINSNNEFCWDVFIHLNFPQIISAFIKVDDYRLISKAAQCIGYCAQNNYIAFDYNLDLLYEICQEYDYALLYKSLFFAYLMISEKESTFIDDFFSQKTSEFLKAAQDYNFKLKNEIALFVASMLNLSSQKHVDFIIKSDILGIIYESINSNKVEFDIFIECFAKVGALLTLSFSADTLSSIFSRLIPYGFLENMDCPEDNDSLDKFTFILSKYPFLFS